MTTFKSLFWFLLLWMVNCTTPLNLEVEWCLQGETPQFTGFFTEVLGLSSGIREIFPKARLVKSVFDNSFDEPLLPDGSKIYDELFDKVRFANSAFIVRQKASEVWFYIRRKKTFGT